MTQISISVIKKGIPCKHKNHTGTQMLISWSRTFKNVCAGICYQHKHKEIEDENYKSPKAGSS